MNKTTKQRTSYQQLSILEVTLNLLLFLLEPIDVCLTDDLPCVNGGTCQGSGATLTCDCPPGFTGEFCEGKGKLFHHMSRLWCLYLHHCTSL